MQNDPALPGGNATLHPVGLSATAEYVQKFAREHGIKPCEAVALFAGFSCYEQYRQARFLYEHGTPELIKALDSGKLSISNAAFLARWPEEAQRDIAILGKREIILWVKRLRMAQREHATEARP